MEISLAVLKLSDSGRAFYSSYDRNNNISNKHNNNINKSVNKSNDNNNNNNSGNAHLTPKLRLEHIEIALSDASVPAKVGISWKDLEDLDPLEDNLYDPKFTTPDRERTYSAHAYLSSPSSSSINTTTSGNKFPLPPLRRKNKTKLNPKQDLMMHRLSSDPADPNRAPDPKSRPYPNSAPMKFIKQFPKYRYQQQQEGKRVQVTPPSSQELASELFYKLYSTHPKRLIALPTNGKVVPEGNFGDAGKLSDSNSDQKLPQLSSGNKLFDFFGKGREREAGNHPLPASTQVYPVSRPVPSKELVSSGGLHHGSSLVCAPIFDTDNVDLPDKIRFYPLSLVLPKCLSGSPVIDPETRHFILKLEEWLRFGFSNSPDFLKRLFFTSQPKSRLLHCVHNPAHIQQTKGCCQRRSTSNKSHRPGASIGSNISTPSSSSLLTSGLYRKGSSSGGTSASEQDNIESDLKAEDRKANFALVHMLELEKCDRFIINPLFGSCMPYKVDHGQLLTKYYAKNRSQPQVPPFTHSTCPSDSSDSGSWIEDFPLHKYSYLGNADAIQAILAQGFDPDQLDRDSWAAIHYASWYGQLGAVKALINIGNCDVNMRNQNDSTPLHFAAWRGHYYVVELLLSHPHLQVDALDKDGKTSLDLCECVPKPEWQGCASLLRAAEKEKLPKVQVDLMDGSNLMVPLVSEADTSAAELHFQVCEELHIPDACRLIFAVWICSESLQIQLKSDQKPLKYISTWGPKVLSRLTDCPDPNREQPRLVFRRDAKLSPEVEKRANMTDAVLGLLFHEAHQNYIRGQYPCSDTDTHMLAAFIIQIIHGDYDSKRNKQFLANDKALARLVPAHRLRSRNTTLINKINAEHKHVSASKISHNVLELERRFLSFCWGLRIYGSAFFNAIVYMNKPTSMKGALHVHVGVNDFGLHLVNLETKKLFQTYPHHQLKWSFDGLDRPYVDVVASLGAGQQHAFVLQTRQATLINTLLCKLNPNASHDTSTTSSQV